MIAASWPESPRRTSANTRSPLLAHHARSARACSVRMKRVSQQSAKSSLATAFPSRPQERLQRRTDRSGGESMSEARPSSTPPTSGGSAHIVPMFFGRTILHPHDKIPFMKKWQFWLGVLISILFIWLSVRGLKLNEFWGAVKQANYFWLIPGIGVYFIGVWVRAWRWHYLLKPIKEIPTKNMFPITTIGYMGNNIYPARAGAVPVSGDIAAACPVAGNFSLALMGGF